jgi:hypothetical protein
MTAIQFIRFFILFTLALIAVHAIPDLLVNIITGR